MTKEVECPECGKKIILQIDYKFRCEYNHDFICICGKIIRFFYDWDEDGEGNGHPRSYLNTVDKIEYDNGFKIENETEMFEKLRDLIHYIDYGDLK